LELSKRDKTLVGIRRLILDVLKSHDPSIIEVSHRLSVLDGISGVNCVLDEVDQETENIKITIEGTNIQYEDVKSVIESLGGVIHSIDGVSAGKKLVDDVETPQDR
jgi:hypothetical protein